MSRAGRHDSMSPGEHLGELRGLLFWYAAFFIGAAGTVHYFREPIAKLLFIPLEGSSTTLQFLSPLDPLIFTLKIDFSLGFIVTLPVLLIIIWRFLGPATDVSWTKALVVLTTALLLALSGVAYAYLAVAPLVLSFMQSLTFEGTTTAFTAMGYINFLFTTAFLLVIIFQIPIFICALAALGILDPHSLAKKRSYVHVSLLAICAVITPTTDILSLFLVALPSMFFTEVGIFVAKIIVKNK